MHRENVVAVSREQTGPTALERRAVVARVVRKDVRMDLSWCLGTGRPPRSQRRNTRSCAPLADFEAELGLDDYAGIARQLSVDVPRCRVVVHGLVTQSWQWVLLVSPSPRLCTQAVLSPVVGWFMRHGLVAHERRRCPRSWELPDEGQRLARRSEGRRTVIDLSLCDWDHRHVADLTVDVVSSRTHVVIYVETIPSLVGRKDGLRLSP